MRRVLLSVCAIAACGDNLSLPDAPRSDARTGDAASDGSADAASDAPTSALLDVTPATGDFGTVGIGTTSPPVMLVAKNGGSVASGLVSFTFGGTHADRFATTSTCGSIAPGATCPVAVTFSPTNAGIAVADLTVSATPGGSEVVMLSGTGVGIQGISIAPSFHPFGAVTVGVTAGPQTFTVSNQGVGTTGALSVTLAGNHPGDYAISSQTCSGAQLVGGGAPCTISFTFTPTATGTRDAVLVVSATPGGTATGGLTGTGL